MTAAEYRTIRSAAIARIKLARRFISIHGAKPGFCAVLNWRLRELVDARSAYYA